MSRKRTHIMVGVPSGAVVAYRMADGQPMLERLTETLGGGYGGLIGALFPDLVEPALHSWHRSIAHSWASGGAGITAAIRWLSALQERCRGAAAPRLQLAEQHSSAAMKIFHQLLAWLWRVLSGVLAGLVPGHVSHLLLDAGTPRGLPALV